MLELAGVAPCPTVPSCYRSWGNDAEAAAGNSRVAWTGLRGCWPATSGVLTGASPGQANTVTGASTGLANTTGRGGGTGWRGRGGGLLAILLYICDGLAWEESRPKLMGH